MGFVASSHLIDGVFIISNWGTYSWILGLLKTELINSAIR